MIRLGKRIANPRVAARSARLGKGACALSALLAFGACETMPFGPSGAVNTSNSTAASNTVTTNPPAPIPSPPKPDLNKSAAPEAVGIVSAETPVPIQKPPVTSLSENQIVGAQAQKVRLLIGQPESVVTNAPSQTWFYASGPCRFSVQFFKDLDSGQYRALKYSVDGGSLQRCLAQFEHLNAAAPIEAQSDSNERSAQAEASSG